METIAQTRVKLLLIARSSRGTIAHVLALVADIESHPLGQIILARAEMVPAEALLSPDRHCAGQAPKR